MTSSVTVGHGRFERRAATLAADHELPSEGQQGLWRLQQGPLVALRYRLGTEPGGRAPDPAPIAMRRHRAQRIAELLELALNREGTARRAKLGKICGDLFFRRALSRRQ